MTDLWQLNTAADERADKPWYALYTRHQHEKTVAQLLSSKGFEVFLPLYSTVRQWKDRRKELSLPLFPCYVFLHGGLDRPLDIVSTPGVQHVVAWGSRPAPIPAAEIEALQLAVSASLRMQPHPFWEVGDRVRVVRGALEGIEGILVRKKNGFRLILSVEMLGKSVAVEVEATTVERVAGQDWLLSSSRLNAKPLLPNRGTSGPSRWL